MGFIDSSTMSLGVDVNSSTLCKSLQTAMKKDDTLTTLRFSGFVQES